MQFQGGPICRSAGLARRLLPVATLALLLIFLGCGRRPTSEQKSEQKIVDLHIASDGDFIAFRPDTLTCPAGALVRLAFHHAGRLVTVRHNWLLTHADQLEALSKDFSANDGVVSKDDPRVITATPLCDKGETVMIQFIAPSPGDYPFLCSTHPEDMRGILHVTKQAFHK
jgi:azurin